MRILAPPLIDGVLKELKASSRPENVAGMARYGISTEGTLGVSMPVLRSMAKRIGRDQGLALELWASGYHEAKILAALVAEPALVDRALMEIWVEEFDSWDVCDQVCSGLFDRTAHRYDVIPDWTRREEEYVRRAGFVMMAATAVHDKKAGDEIFLSFFPLMEKGSDDRRNYVKKAVNWAIRQTGKRNLRLHGECIRLAERIGRRDAPSAKWIASDALRELLSAEVRKRLEAKEARKRM